MGASPRAVSRWPEREQPPAPFRLPTVRARRIGDLTQVKRNSRRGRGGVIGMINCAAPAAFGSGESVSEMVAENPLSFEGTVYVVAAVRGAFLIRTGSELVRVGVESEEAL